MPEANVRYMMATKAIHQLGDISRKAPDLCLIYDEDNENYIGNWVTGYGFINVKFPKATTRELSEEEKSKYHNMRVAVGNNVLGTIKTKVPKNMTMEVRGKVIRVTTDNSIYRFGRANKKGERTVSRDANPLSFSRCAINFLAIGEEMELHCLDGPFPNWYTTTVRSIRSIK